MWLRTIFAVIFLSRCTIDTFEFPYQTRNYTKYHDCEFNWSRTQDIIFYKPTVDYIMKIVTSDPIADDFYEKYVTFIDKYGPRPAGSLALENAIDHMIDLTLHSGVDEITTENVEVPHWRREYESLTMILPDKKEMSILGLGPSVPTPDNGITADLVVVNSFEEFEELDVYIRDKIVLFNRYFTTYEETVKYRLYGASIAAKRGAVAVLIRSITPFSLYTPHTGSVKYEKGIKKIPAAAITLEDADFLQRIYNRNVRIVVDLKMYNSFDTKISRNIIIDLKGTEDPEKYVIVSGHIDSWDVGRGAIDNGGGMMINWFVPIILNNLSLKPKRTIRSILWTSEEPGYIGGYSYLKKHANELQNIDFIMESDIGTFEPLGLEVVGSKDLKCLIANVLKLFAPIDKLQDVNTTGSEIALFFEKGIPGATLLNRNELYFLYHHTEADTLTAQNKTNVVKCAAFWAAVAYVIADLPFEIPP